MRMVRLDIPRNHQGRLGFPAGPARHAKCNGKATRPPPLSRGYGDDPAHRPVGPHPARILTIRGQRVMLDADLASVYGVTTRRLSEQVKRNRDRFPADFMFRLTAREKAEVVAICDHLARLRFSPSLPYAFTEHGAIMLASVLNSRIAIEASVQIVRAFIRLREMLSANKDLARRLTELEQRYDRQFKVVFDAIRELMTQEQQPRRQIGFKASSKS